MSAAARMMRIARDARERFPGTSVICPWDMFARSPEETRTSATTCVRWLPGRSNMLSGTGNENVLALASSVTRSLVAPRQ